MFSRFGVDSSPGLDYSISLMEEASGKNGNWILIALLLALVSTAYVKIAYFRNTVDSKFPWVNAQLTKHGIILEPATPADATPDSTPASLDSKPAPVLIATSAGLKAAESTPTGPVPPLSASDLAKIEADPALLPKTVKIKNAAVFPAVLQGKEVGTVNVPAGTEVRTVRVASGKLGVAYSADGSKTNLGGKWVAPEETDLAERMQGRR